MKIFLKLFLVSVLMFSVFACSDEAEEIVESITESTSSESEEKEAHSDEEKEAHSDEEDHGKFKFGLILVGPRDDKGWSQAHFEGG